MFKQLTTAAALVIGLSGSAMAAGEGGHVENVDFPFDGMFGSYDEQQLQRGLKVYTEVCSACHGLQYVAFRTLADEGGPGFTEAQARAYADQNFEVFDAELDDFRAAKPTDHFPKSALENAPDLSLMAKARAGFHGPYGLGINQFVKGMGGPEYIVALLNGYADAPSCAPEDFDGFYNTAFAAGGYPDECKDEDGHHKYPGSWIAMAQPLDDELVEFDDGHANDLHHLSEDVSAFLMWTAEPKLNDRKQSGLLGIFFLGLLTVLLYLTNKRIWAPIKKGAKGQPAE